MATLLPRCMADVRVEIGAVPDVLEGATAEGVLWQATARQLLLEVPDLARLLIGRDEIVMAPLRADAARYIGPFLRRVPLMAIMLLRGAFACNGAAVAGPDGAVLLVGETSTGKSTLAAALARRGLGLLADDAAPIALGPSGSATILPVWPELVLWSDAIAALFPAGAPSWLEPEAGDPFGVPYWHVSADRVCSSPMPLRAIYRIMPDRLADRVTCETVRGAAKLTSGALAPYQSRIAEALADPTSLLRIHGAASAAAPLQVVRLPHLDVREMESVADRVLQDCGWHTTI